MPAVHKKVCAMTCCLLTLLHVADAMEAFRKIQVFNQTAYKRALKVGNVLLSNRDTRSGVSQRSLCTA